MLARRGLGGLQPDARIAPAAPAAAGRHEAAEFGVVGQKAGRAVVLLRRAAIEHVELLVEELDARLGGHAERVRRCGRRPDDSSTCQDKCGQLPPHRRQTPHCFGARTIAASPPKSRPPDFRGQISLPLTLLRWCNGDQQRQIRREAHAMAGSVNKVILVGNLGRDPEVRTFQNGGKVCNLRIATSENWKDRATGRAEGKDRMAFGRDLQREPRPDRGAVPEEGLQGLSRGAARDAEVAGPVRAGPLFDRGGAAHGGRVDGAS